MNNLQKILLVASLIAVPAGAQSFFAPSKATCLTAGTWTYQLSSQTDTPDYRIRVRADAAAPDLRMQMVDRPDIADFVIADDVEIGEGNLCKVTGGLKTVRVGPEETTPDVTVMLTREAEAPDYTLYVHSARLSPQDAAAVLAVMWKAKQSAAAGH